MKQYWKDKWITALRSKEYEQTTDQLKYGNKFCCLGVLVDLVTKEKPELGHWIGDNFYCLKNNLTISCSIPSVIQEEIHEKFVPVNAGDIQPVDTKENTLAYANDYLKLNFLQIAKIIEKER